MSRGATHPNGLANSRYLAVAWALLVFFRLALAVAPYRLVSRILPDSQGEAAPPWAQARARWAIGRAAPTAFRATCLPQAMATKMLLALQGYSSWIRIGVRRGDNGAIQAHAWVLAGDKVVVGDDERLDSFSILTDLHKTR